MRKRKSAPRPKNHLHNIKHKKTRELTAILLGVVLALDAIRAIIDAEIEHMGGKIEIKKRRRP